MTTPTGSDIGIFVAMTFVLGILLVWLYAAIRSRYGPGPKAAVVAGLFGWVLLCGITLAIAAVAAGWIAIPTSRYA